MTLFETGPIVMTPGISEMAMFAFESVEKTTGPIWLENYDKEHARMYRMDAEALVEDLNRMPSGKGSWLRCLEVDHGRSYESQFKDWDACIWFQRGMGVKKMVKSTGEVMDCIDPHPPLEPDAGIPVLELGLVAAFMVYFQASQPRALPGRHPVQILHQGFSIHAVHACMLPVIVLEPYRAYRLLDRLECEHRHLFHCSHLDHPEDGAFRPLVGFNTPPGEGWWSQICRIR